MSDELKKILELLSSGQKEFYVKLPTSSRNMKVEILDISFLSEWGCVNVKCIDTGFQKEIRVEKEDNSFSYDIGYNTIMVTEYIDAYGQTERYSPKDFIL